jgi:hypothetical protein
MHQNNISKQYNKHAYSFILSPTMLKYSRKTLPKEILLGHGGVTYRRTIAPNLCKNDGLSKEIEKLR